MFTGLVTHRGVVRGAHAVGANRRLTLRRPDRRLRRGDSVALNGVCLTVATGGADAVSFDVVPETLRRTTLSGLRKGDRVNVELPLRYGQRLGGHFVLGHVDAVGVATQVSGGSRGAAVRVSFPGRYQRYVVAKGSVALDGVSLTVVAVGRGWLTVALVPYTLRHTTLGDLAVGGRLNIEFDIFARYCYAPRRP